MIQYTLEPTEGRDVTFIGEEIACNTSAAPYATTTYTLYKTQAGRLVLHRIRKSIMSDRSEEEVTTHEDEESLTDTIGFTETAKALYKKAGIQTTLHID